MQIKDSTMKTRSFTLIELLIVLVIIGILSSLAMPQYTKLVMNAKGVEAVNTLQAISDAVWRYYQETGRFPQPNPLSPEGQPIPYSTLGISIPESKYWGHQYWYEYYDPITNTGSIKMSAEYKNPNAQGPDGSSVGRGFPRGTKVHYEVIFTYDQPFHICKNNPNAYHKMNDHWYINYMHVRVKSTDPVDYDLVAGW